MDRRAFEGHPGVPPYTENVEAMPAGSAPAARAIRKGDPEPSRPHPACSPRPPVLGGIVERTPVATSVGPPSLPSATRSPPPSTPAADAREIAAENHKVLAAMTEQEILAEQAHLKSILPPKLVERWTRPRSPHPGPE